ncbi:MAG TPA: GPR endopeptidase, partial [Haloplasmataceae bacterium]
IGVPTVVDAVTITHDVIDMLLKHLSYHLKNTRASSKIIPAASERIANIEEVEPLSEELTAELLGKIGLMTNEEKRQLIREVLTPQGLNMMVTPKEIDQDIEDLAQIIARGINLAMHKGIE